MTKRIVCLATLLAAIQFAGCESYTWKSAIPPERRTVAVPVFRNETSITRLGDVVTRQILREFEREGTMRIASSEEAAYEIQGELKEDSATTTAYNRRIDTRLGERNLRVKAVVSIIDRRSGRIIVENRPYVGEASYIYTGDDLTSRRDASGRLAEDLASRIVDDTLGMKTADK